MTLIRDLIEIPERVFQDDLVLKLTDGLAHADRTLRDYVVTPELARNFADAMEFVREAVEGNSSKAAYLHGSFGSGKSHFMAVLHLLLSGNAQARSIPELAEVVASSNSWVQGRKFLLVPYHMIGATDMESAILGGYAAHIRELHPEAPAPGFYLSESLFADAERQRAAMGDEAFFKALNTDSGGGGGGWGELGGDWDSESFVLATSAPPADPERVRLVTALVGTLFSSYGKVAAASDNAFLSLDEGLSVLSQHAQSLGYDAVILFLDELILWLATHMADLAFISREGPKLSKLVEAQSNVRPAPIISFVARQRDLREFIGDNVAGAQLVAIADSLKWWEARFHRITLNDTNLPAVAEKRLLRPKNEAARIDLDQSFEQALRVRQEVLDTLLTSDADRAMFRQVYPFSPALMQTLIAVSSALQRQRTALRLMLQLLAQNREHLELGQIVSVGDLWDVIAEGDQPFDDHMRAMFDDAKRLYRTKLLPLLEAEHSVKLSDVEQGTADPTKVQLFRNDARLLKTLLLAALVPEVEPLKALTAQRLAALNHGSIKTPIPGQEAQITLGKLRQWAAQVGEIKVGEDQNPLISIQISSVDTDRIIENARIHDNAGNRRRMVRTTLFHALGIQESDDLFTRYSFSWRGTHREVDIAYDNVREMADDRLTARGDGWSIVIDFPFDDPPHGPTDDIARLNGYQSTHPAGSRTLVWLPNFMSDAAQRDLGLLVILDHIRTGTRFNEYAGHLSPTEREQARALLSNQRSGLQQRLTNALLAAYGTATEPKDAIRPDLEPNDHFQTLHDTLTLRSPVGATFQEAFENLLDQAFAHDFPAHPTFSEPVRTTDVKKVYAEIESTLAEPGRRRLIERAMRPLMTRIAQALQIGQMGDTHFVLSDHWSDHFHREQGKSGESFKVGNLRRWIDEPKRMGLPRDLQNLIILVFAEQTDRAFYQHGGVVRPTIDNLDDELELRSEALPSEADWKTAHSRAQAIFGKVYPEVRNAGNVRRLADEIQELATQQREDVDTVRRRLEERLVHFGLDPNVADRNRTANAVVALTNALTYSEGKSLIEALVNAEIATSETAMGTAFAQAPTLLPLLAGDDWPLFDALEKLNDSRAQAAGKIIQDLKDALVRDEHVESLKAAFSVAKQRAIRLLSETKDTPPPASPPQPPTGEPGRRIVTRGDRKGLTANDAKALFEDLQNRLEIDSNRRASVQWSIDEPEEEL